ncbi:MULTISPECIES: helix-turn-helix domain-containing protein [unclassified Streptomyces]|uniref:helix-turn-helix domain-containing protein n=1 Tax=unclassified Streptomyces TaxID=2593676 RepID=UPI0034136A27
MFRTRTWAPPGTYQRGRQLKGLARRKAAENLADDYLNKKLSIRAICERTGMSYGLVHRLLTEDAKVELRSRGGDHRTSKEGDS